MQYTIYRIKNADEFFDRATGEAVPYLSYEEPVGWSELVSTGGVDATLEELVHLCDHDAENNNTHNINGVHRLLGAVLFNQVGREKATEIMLWIALRRGLHGMNGACVDGDAYDELKVGKNGRDWDGKYGE